MSNVATLDRPPSVMLEQYLLPITPYLAGELTDLCINRPRELWVKGADGWIRHEVPALTLQHCSLLATTWQAEDADPVGHLARRRTRASGVAAGLRAAHGLHFDPEAVGHRMDAG